MHRLRTDLCQVNLLMIVRTLKTKKAVFFSERVNRKMTFFIYAALSVVPFSFGISTVDVKCQRLKARYEE